MKTPGLLAVMLVAGAGLVQAQDLPEAVPGQCYAKVLLPAEFDERTERVLVQPRATTLRVRPAEYETSTEDIVIREEFEEYKLIPAKYEYVNKRIMIAPEKRVSTVLPPTFKDVQERVVVTPAHYVWKPGRGPFERIDRATGEILCRVEVPAVYRTVKKRIVATPARVKTRVIPAKYKTVRVRVVTRPAEVVKRVIPAETRSFEVERQVNSERTYTDTIEEVFRTIDTNVKTSSDRFEYRPILCETNATPAVIRRLQRALRTSGFYKGRIDGRMGRGTEKAISSFQRKNNLEVGGLTLRTLEVLGVDL